MIGQLRDALGEALVASTRRPARSALTALGTVLGTGALVATLGLTATAQAQISQRFDALQATEVVLRDDDPAPASLSPARLAEAERSLRRLNGVEVAGTSLTAADPLAVTTVPDRASAGPAQETPVLAVSPNLLPAVRASVTDGRPFTTADEEQALPVALVGRAAAQTLDLAPADRQPVIFVAGTPLRVAGIITEAGTRSDLLLSVVVPVATSARLPGFRVSTLGWTARTRLGAARQVGEEAPLAVRPTAPETLIALVPPDPATLRGQVEADVQNLYLLLAGLTLLVGTVSISNSALVSVVERRTEIGVRRALGASRGSIVVQFVLESGTLGFLGGVAGAAVGVDTVVAVSAYREWTATFDPRTALLAPLAGAVVGLLAGAYPAYRAARVTPVEALRQL